MTYMEEILTSQVDQLKSKTKALESQVNELWDVIRDMRVQLDRVGARTIPLASERLEGSR